MNELSWLLYLADVSSSFRVLAFGTAALSAVGIGVGTFIWCVVSVDGLSDTQQADANKFWRSAAKWFAPAALISYLIYALLPSQNTLMLIAASQAGEQVLSSQKAQEIGGEAGALASDSIKLLRKYIHDQLGDGVPAAPSK